MSNEDQYSSYINELVLELKEKKLSKTDLSRLKIKLCSKYHLKQMPTDIEILMGLPVKEQKELLPFLQTKPVRSLSGVTVCAVMTKPRECPHGKCTYCPGGPKSIFGSVPQSYTGKEPATRRAIRNKYDPYLQMFNRLEQYVVSGHMPEKIEIIIMGGTFPSYPVRYQKDFTRLLFKAMNDFSKQFFSGGKLRLKKFKHFFELPGKVDNPKREKRIQKKILELKKSSATSSLHLEQRKNENSKIRGVGLTIETRPDYAGLKHAKLMLELGCTRVELGVQSLDDDVLQKIERGHDVAQSIKATRQLKDLGLKINYHMMPGLPGSTPESDILGFRKLFSDPDFKPDMLKIYPCMVMKGTALYDTWKKGNFKPLSTEEAAKLIINLKKHVPPFVRIMRVQRDIPTFATEAGVSRTNLRQMIDQQMSKDKMLCNCIRCREIGRRSASGKAKLNVLEYDASCGKEFFLSIDKGDALIGFCRLRFPSQFLTPEITLDSAIVRELHVYGETVNIGDRGKLQHAGFGRKLLLKAEQISKKAGKSKILVISGVGARQYYRKFGYKRQGFYMLKKL